LARSSRRPLLIVAPRSDDARKLHEQILVWSDPSQRILHFPESEALPFERLVSDDETAQQRIRVLAELVALGSERHPLPLRANQSARRSSPAKEEEETNLVVVASASAIAQKTLSRSSFDVGMRVLSRGDQVDMDDLLHLWRRLGYRFEHIVDAPGTASRRGGILDIFPVGAEYPVRMELWGSEIDSIRTFDLDTQRSLELLDSVEIIPAHETLPALADQAALEQRIAGIGLANCTDETRDRLTEEFNQLLDGHEVEEANFYAGLFNTGTLLDYFPAESTVVLVRPEDITHATWETDEHAHELRAIKEQRGELPEDFPSSHLLWREVEPQFDRFLGRLEVLKWGATDLTHQDVLEMPFSSPSRFLGDLGRFCEEVREMSGAGHRVVAVSALPRRLGEVMAERKIAASLPESLDAPPAKSDITVLPSTGAGLSDGFVLSSGASRLVVFSDAEIFGVAKRRRSSKRKVASFESRVAELQPGEYVVHVEHGVAKFLGTGKSSGDTSDDGPEFLILEYAAGDKLYVPMEQIDRIMSYVAPMERSPSLSRLGSPEWKKTKEKVAKATREMAAELLALYAARHAVERPPYKPDSQWEAQLEDSFPYEETPDQLRTVGEVKEDMTDTKPMDRLVCGDVGYGKTEIALRAAFKVVMDGRQVAVLVPTTVLAQQHYVTFTQRLAAFPVRIEVLSRFRTDHEQDDIVERLARGEVDICIGTHRLIQKDVRFKNLGLVVVDEEQRFGVVHKERLKQMRREVDVLTLTATPIPRTLHMSMAGIRDMSTIETPPEERLPIKTYISEFSDALIREAILREIDRQGQVYFLHNRVQSIGYIADYIRRIAPEAEVGVAHGQMAEGQLEQAMLDFANGEMDVLVCTTIIESGLDIPNVNTLIIDRADTFGLSQLYQLRGRVGRGSKRAYAYLLVPPTRSVSETAEKRLRTMLAATELGAGFRIAMKDLEIRGAGNLLGPQQSGHIYAVGFEMYTRMLQEAAEELRARQAAGLPITANGAEPGDRPDAIGMGEAAVQEVEALLSGIEKPEEQAVVIDVGLPASVPPDYVADLPTRLGLYQRLMKMESEDEAVAMETELLDRFGPLPWPVRNLLYGVRLRVLAQRANVLRVTKEDNRIVLRLRHEVGGARNVLQRLFRNRVEVGNTQLRIPLPDGAEGWEKTLVDVLKEFAEFQGKLLAETGAARG
ncbi:MAG: transcription-repair coupling factor, partial [SAR202 cluster bacterium]|nr:transcription-repair coupling factor [SAR202 cluster bacterium]